MIRGFAFLGFLAFLHLTPDANAEGCEQPDALRNTDTPYSLNGHCLEFKPLSPGSRLPIGSIVYFPMANREGALTMSVERSALSKQFVDDLFERPDDSLLATHQLAQKGIALVLTPRRLKMTIYPSVIVSLRSDIPGDPTYRSFTDRPVFTIEEVSGKAFASTDVDRISTAFSDVYIQHIVRMSKPSTKVLSDGRTQFTGSISDSLPPRQLPSKASK